MATEIVTTEAQDIASAIGKIAVTLDGVSAFLEDLAQSDDMQTSRMAFTFSNLMGRITHELEDLAQRVFTVKA